MKAKASGLSYIDVSWTAVDGATSYVVYYRLSLENGEENGQEVGTEFTYTTANNYITIERLLEDKTYIFWVKAKNSIGDSGRSNVVSARSCFPAPAGVSAYAQGKGYANVSCSPVRGATGYEIYAQARDSSTKVLLKKSVGCTSIVVGGLKSQTDYKFYAKAVCGTKTSDYSSASYWVWIH